MTKATIKNVNAAIKALGGEEELIRGNGYLYFWSDEASGWYTSSVPVCYLSHLSLQQWIEECKSLKEANANHQKPVS